MGSGQQRPVRPAAFGRAFDAHQHALRRADSRRPRRAAGAGLEKAGVLPGASEGHRGLRARVHVAGRAPGDGRRVRHAGDHVARRPAGAVRQAGSQEPRRLESVGRHHEHRAGPHGRGRPGRGRAAPDGHPRRNPAEPVGAADEDRHAGRRIVLALALLLPRGPDRRCGGGPRKRRGRLLPRLRAPANQGEIGGSRAMNASIP